MRLGRLAHGPGLQAHQAAQKRQAIGHPVIGFGDEIGVKGGD
jgi:hypothetical protein